MTASLLDDLIETVVDAECRGLQPCRWMLTSDADLRLRKELQANALSSYMLPPQTLLGLPFEVTHDPSDVPFMLISDRGG